MKNGSCPNCGANTRQKALVFFLEKYAGTPTGSKKVLYFAPDMGPMIWLKKSGTLDVTTADISAPGVDVHWDITNVPAPDRSFDLIICSHVLEHVPDDWSALGELRRLLRSDGLLLLQVPYSRDSVTDEDPSIKDANERKRRFGQFDHIRIYGKDLPERLSKSGFDVTLHFLEKEFSRDQMNALQLWNDVVFACRPKPSLAI